MPSPQPRPRFNRLDALRGVAMVWMTVYHFAFDLNHYRWIKQDFYRDPVWTWQRTCIVSLFLLCAGAGQAVGRHQGQSWQRFGRRWAQIAACALLVSAASYAMYPKSFIYFGVLQGIAVMLIIVRLTAHWGAWLWLLGAVAIATKFIAAYALATWTTLQFLNAKPWNWLGLISVKPITEDYVPLIPWLGVMWWGVAATQWLLRARPALLTGAVPAGTRWLVWLGCWSLVYYLLHQPVMIGLLELVQRLR
ncbi:MAG: heparan-alpha-glucosaminide N-acetyltransferase [Burkholderiaceae bacterium]